MASHLEYNGIRLGIMRTNAYIQQPIHSEDGSDQIGTLVTIDVDAIYNPEVTSYAPTGSGPVQSYGQFAPMTDTAVAAALMAKRGQLTYVVGNHTVIQSPAPGYAVDIQNGPQPRHCVARQINERTWRVNYRVETAIRDCSPAGIGLVSNRWRQSHQVGADHLSTVTTQGIAIFRTDVLANLDVTADYFRSVLMPKHILDFQRVSIVARLNEIGNVLTYEVIDRERSTQIGSQTAATYGVVDFNAGLQVSTVPAGEGGIAGPVCMATFDCVVRGDRNSKRSGLYAWASRLAIEKLGIPPEGELPADQAGRSPIITHVHCGEQIDRPIVTLQMVAKYIPNNQNLGAIKGVAWDLLGFDPGRYFANPNVDQSIFLEGVTDGTNPQMPLGTRGHFDGMMFAQAMTTALQRCQSFAPAACLERVPGYGPDDPVSGTPPVAPGSYFCNSKPLVDVSVGPVLFPITPTNFSSTLSPHLRSDPDAVTDYRQDVQHTKSRSVIVAPVAGYAGQETPPLVFRLGQSIDYRTVNWTAERIGSPPKIPHPRSNDHSEVLVGHEITAATPELGPDAVAKIQRVSGSYTYAQTRRLGPGRDPLPMGAVPYANFQYGDNLITDNEYKHGMAGPNSVYIPPSGDISDPDFDPAEGGGTGPIS